WRLLTSHSWRCFLSADSIRIVVRVGRPDDPDLRNDCLAAIGAGLCLNDFAAAEILGVAVYEDDVAAPVVTRHESTGVAAGLAKIIRRLRRIDRRFADEKILQEDHGAGGLEDFRGARDDFGRLNQL